MRASTSSDPTSRRGGPDPLGPTGRELDRLLAVGQFVVEEPDSSEFVCGDRGQFLRKLEECRRRGIRVTARWKRADGTVTRQCDPLPPGWGIERRGDGRPQPRA